MTGEGRRVYVIYAPGLSLTASLKASPALNLGVLSSGMVIFWEGFLGFTPILEARWETENCPNPEMLTLSPERSKS